MQQIIDAYAKAKADLDGDVIAWETADLEYTAAFWKLINAEPRDAEEVALKIKFAVDHLEIETMGKPVLAKFLTSMINFATRD